MLFETFFVNINDINLRPTEPDGGSIDIRWDNSPDSLLIQVELEPEGEEVSGSVNLDWDHMEILIRLIPRVDGQRLFWTPEVTMDFTLDSISPSKHRISEGVVNGIRDQLQSYLEEWIPVIMPYFLSLPMRPMPDQNGSMRLSTLGIISLSALSDLVRYPRVDLDETGWGDFKYNFVNACLLPNNPLRSIFLTGEFPDFNMEFQPARFMDHYVRHVADPVVRDEPGIGPSMVFDVEPPGSHDYHEEAYEHDIVQREKYQITIDHLILEEQTYAVLRARTPGSVPTCQIEWDIHVGHPGLSDNEWVIIRQKEVSVRLHSNILDPQDNGVSIDWLETGGDMWVIGRIRVFGDEVANFEWRHHVTNEITPGSIIVLHDSNPTVTARGRLARMTSLNSSELDWLRIILRELFVEIPGDPIDFFLQLFGHAPEGVIVERWLTYEILSRLHVMAYINGVHVSTTNFNEAAAHNVLHGMGCTFQEDHSTFDFYFEKNVDAEFTIRFVLADIHVDGTTDVVHEISEVIRRNDPAYPDTEWRVQPGGQSARIVIEEPGNPLRVSLGIRNELAPQPPLEHRPKPYDIIFTALHIRRDTEPGKGEMKFRAKMWTEINGCPSDDETEVVLDSLRVRAPYDRALPEDVVKFTPEVGVGGIIHLEVRGKEYDPIRDDNLGTAELALTVPHGNGIDDDIHESSATRYFHFHARSRTASSPPEILFAPEGAGTDLEGNYTLTVLPTGSWFFRYGVSWAESFALQYSPERGTDASWEDVDDEILSSLIIGETIESQEVPSPLGGQRAGYYRLIARNIAEHEPTTSKLLTLSVS